MAYTWLTSRVALALFAGMLLLLDVGRRIGARRRVADPDGAQAGTGAVDGAVFALLSLLVAFTFSGAATRFDERRSLIVQETNDIGAGDQQAPANAIPNIIARLVETETWRNAATVVMGGLLIGLGYGS